MDVSSANSIEVAIQRFVPFEKLNPSLQQQITNPQYRSRVIIHAISRGVPYTRLPAFIRLVVHEKRFAELTISVSLDRFLLFPYSQLEVIVQHTGETPLTYYQTMIAMLLKAEKSYDTLPNFTAVDVLNLLGIGRNQYLQLTKDVRSKLWWRVHPTLSRIKDLLPNVLIPTVSLDPTWMVLPVPESAETKLPENDLQAAQLYKQLLKRAQASDAAPSGGGAPSSLVNRASKMGSFFGKVTTGSSSNNSNSNAPAAAPTASGNNLSSSNLSVSATSSSKYAVAAECPKEVLLTLYRHALVVPMVAVDASDIVEVPPLENFVMNRTTDDAQEAILYKVLSTLDSRTNMDVMAQLLSLELDEVCDAVDVFLRLGLVRRVQPLMPYDVAYATVVDEDGELLTPHVEGAVHPSWGPAAVKLAVDTKAFYKQREENADKGLDPVDSMQERRGPKRIALLYDARFTGLLMMTNLSADPTFKQHAVTLFEIGKLTDESVDAFLQKLQSVQRPPPEVLEAMRSSSVALGGNGGVSGAQGIDGGSAAASMQASLDVSRLIDSVLSLRNVLHTLRHELSSEQQEALTGSGRDTTDHCWVDLLKVETINELEAKTRYVIIGRNYSAFFSVSPLSQTPLLDLEVDNLFCSSASLVPSAWLLLYLYSKAKRGPKTVCYPFGFRVPVMSPLLLKQPGHSTTLRMVPLGLDAEVTYCQPQTALLLINEMTTTAPLFIQRVADIPKYEKSNGFVVDCYEYFTLEVVIPFSCRGAEEVRECLREAVEMWWGEQGCRRAMQCTSTTTADAKETQRWSKKWSSRIFNDLDNTSELEGNFESAVEALQLRNAVGYFTFLLVLEDEELKAHRQQHIVVVGGGGGGKSSPLARSANVADRTHDANNKDGLLPQQQQSTAPSQEEGNSAHRVDVVAPLRPFRVHTSHIIDLGFGFPLHLTQTCDRLRKHLIDRRLLSPQAVDAHNKSLKALAASSLAFLEQYHSVAIARAMRNIALDDPNLEQSVRHSSSNNNNNGGNSTASLAVGGGGGSSSSSGVGSNRRVTYTHQHLRTLGRQTNGGAPFPLLLMGFDGVKIHSVNTLDPCSEPFL